VTIESCNLSDDFESTITDHAAIEDRGAIARHALVADETIGRCRHTDFNPDSLTVSGLAPARILRSGG